VATLSGLLYEFAVCSSVHPFIGVDGVVSPRGIYRVLLKVGVDGVVGVVRSCFWVYTVYTVYTIL
jgi:hypothetical protein